MTLIPSRRGSGLELGSCPGACSLLSGGPPGRSPPPQLLPAVLRASTYRAQQSMGQVPRGPRRSGFSAFATGTEPTLPEHCRGTPAVVLDPANPQQPVRKKEARMWLLRQGHVTAHTPLFVTALVAVWIETGWETGTCCVLLGSGNHTHAENHMEASWGGLVERYDPTVMGSRGERGPTLEGRE